MNIETLLRELEKTVNDLRAENERLQFIIDSLCTCIENPQDEQHLLVDKKCPIHGRKE